MNHMNHQYLPARGPFGWTVGENGPSLAESWGLTPVWPWFAGAAVLVIIIAWASSGSKKKQRRRPQKRRGSVRVDFPEDRSPGRYR